MALFSLHLVCHSFFTGCAEPSITFLIVTETLEKSVF